MDFFDKLTKELTIRNIKWIRHENHISANGYNIHFGDEGFLLYSPTGLKCNHHVLIHPKEVIWYITSSAGSLQEDISYVLDKKGDFRFRKKRFLEKHVKSKANTKKINNLLLRAHAQDISEQFAFTRIKNILRAKSAKGKIEPNEPQQMGDITLPLPLDPLFVVEGVSIVDFVITEFLTSFPGAVREFIKISKGNNFYPYQLEYCMSEGVKVKDSWKEQILNSPYKLKTYKLILYLLSRGENYSLLKTRNKHIWAQIAVIYGIEKVDFRLLTGDFIEKLKGFSITI